MVVWVFLGNTSLIILKIKMAHYFDFKGACQLLAASKLMPLRSRAFVEAVAKREKSYLSDSKARLFVGPGKLVQLKADLAQSLHGTLARDPVLSKFLPDLYNEDDQAAFVLNLVNSLTKSGLERTLL